MSWNDGLSGKALAIAECNSSPLRVMAGPGTGKSYSLQRRVARLLEEGADPRRILAVTFTRNAALSLVSDLHQMRIGDSDKVKVGTLHSLCLEILNKEEVLAQMGRSTRMVLTFTKSAILRFEGETMLLDLTSPRVGQKRDCTRRIVAFEAAWARLQSETPGWPTDPIDQEFHRSITDWLRFHEAMLIGELIPEALRYLRDNPHAPTRAAFDHILVDEYQDLNRAEQELVDLLVAEPTSLTIVGDIDQSIYRFRYANPQGIQEFHRAHSGTRDETLDECRRCPTSVVRVADCLIRRNHGNVYEPRLLPRNENEAGSVTLVQWQGFDEEVAGIASFIQTLICAGHYSPGRILVIASRKLIGFALRDKLREKGTRVNCFFNEDLLESCKAQRSFAILTLLSNPHDRVALRWWLGHGDPNGRKVPYAKLRKYCETAAVSPRIALGGMLKGDTSVRGAESLVGPFTELIDLESKLLPLPVERIVDVLFPESDEELRPMREMAMAALEKRGDLKGIVESLVSHIAHNEMPEDGDYVRVMSLFKSKGLTSDVAIVMGCNQGIIPSKSREDDPDPEEHLREQRRLFYVAITRCTKLLVLSSMSTVNRSDAYRMGIEVRSGGERIAHTIASQFITELGPTVSTISGDKWAANGYGLNGQN